MTERVDEENFFNQLDQFDGAQGRNRTTDTAIFSRMLYQLSYLGIPREVLEQDRRAGAL
jgi:hypothetical protein